MKRYVKEVEQDEIFGDKNNHRSSQLFDSQNEAILPINSNKELLVEEYATDEDDVKVLEEALGLNVIEQETKDEKVEKEKVSPMKTNRSHIPKHNVRPNPAMAMPSMKMKPQQNPSMMHPPMVSIHHFPCILLLNLNFRE
jgi:hypothetical protein